MYNDNNYYDDYSYNGGNINRFNLKRVIIIGIIALVIIIIGIIVVNKITNYYNSYEYFEKQMIEKAKNYIVKNNIVISEEIYLDIEKLNMNVKDSCSQISGVFVDRNYNYRAYLVCNDYKTDIIANDETKAKLNGDEVILLAKGINYIEKGVTDNKNVNIQGVVGTEAGVYNLNYIVMNNNQILTSLTRKVVIIDNNYIKSLYPTIVLQGDEVEYIRKGERYVEKGVVANDPVDYNITNKIESNGIVDTNTLGEYEIIYSVTNSRGFTSSIIRKVVVINNFSETLVTATLNTVNATSQDVTITLRVIGNSYDHMLLPDGSISHDKIITYKVSKNDTYYFDSYDQDGKVVTKVVPVKNINKEKPTAVCTAQIYASHAKVNVTSTSNSKISSYNYMANGISSGEQLSTNYKISMNNINKVNVIIKDSLGNTNDITCTLDTTYSYLRDLYVDSKGKNCLEGYICYNQADYKDRNVRFCSSSGENSCGPVSRNGCSVTSFATVISLYQIKNAYGQPYNPEELVVEHFNKICESSCSGSRTAERVALRLGLSASVPYHGIAKNKAIMIDYLKKGYPLLFTSNGESAVYPAGNGHILSILGINEKGEVFLSDPGRTTTTSAKSKKHKVNSWVTIEEIASGAGENAYFQAICPKGMCQGEEKDPGKYQNY